MVVEVLPSAGKHGCAFFCSPFPDPRLQCLRCRPMQTKSTYARGLFTGTVYRKSGLSQIATDNYCYHLCFSLSLSDLLSLPLNNYYHYDSYDLSYSHSTHGRSTCSVVVHTSLSTHGRSTCSVIGMIGSSGTTNIRSSFGSSTKS